MTRLAVQHQAANLSQGFTDEAPLFELVWGGISAALGGDDAYMERFEALTLKQLLEEQGGNLEAFLEMPLKDLLAQIQNPRDRFNQYSFPFGLPELREAIADYTDRFYCFRPDPETEITVVLGATEGLSSVLRAVCKPGDGIIVFQPFHEMYPSQGDLFGLRSQYVTLRENVQGGTWEMDRDELRNAVDEHTRAIILNTPHNPTGKVFTRDDLRFIADLCKSLPHLTPESIRRRKEEHFPAGPPKGRKHSHAWFICFAPFDSPAVAMSVVLEYGGAGGSNAAPVANEILRWIRENRPQYLHGGGGWRQ